MSQLAALSRLKWSVWYGTFEDYWVYWFDRYRSGIEVTGFVLGAELETIKE